jgi:hypothetical protein
VLDRSERGQIEHQGVIDASHAACSGGMRRIIATTLPACDSSLIGSGGDAARRDITTTANDLAPRISCISGDRGRLPFPHRQEGTWPC